MMVQKVKAHAAESDGLSVCVCVRDRDSFCAQAGFELIPTLASRILRCRCVPPQSAFNTLWGCVYILGAGGTCLCML